MANDDNIAGPKRRPCGTETAIEVPFSVLQCLGPILNDFEMGGREV